MYTVRKRALLFAFHSSGATVHKVQAYVITSERVGSRNQLDNHSECILERTGISNHTWNLDNTVKCQPCIDLSAPRVTEARLGCVVF